jgi:site-specific DNA recombinase
MHPLALKEFIVEFQRDLKNRQMQESQDLVRKRKKLKELQQAVDRFLDRIEKGTDTPASNTRLVELDQEKIQLEKELKSEEVDRKVMELHPNLGKIYDKKVKSLQESLNSNETRRREAAQIIRSMVDKIEVHPGDGRGEVKIDIRGDLAAVMHFASGNQVPLEQGMLKLVARGGVEPPTHGL